MLPSLSDTFSPTTAGRQRVLLPNHFGECKWRLLSKRGLQGISYPRLFYRRANWWCMCSLWCCLCLLPRLYGILMILIATHTAGCSGFVNASDQTTAPLTFQPLARLRAGAVVHHARCRYSACEICRSIDLGRSAWSLWLLFFIADKFDWCCLYLFGRFIHQYTCKTTCADPII